MKLTIQTAISEFGVAAKAKLANPVATGQPEDQIRAPFEQLLLDIATLSGFPSGSVVAVGESSVSDLKTRPDYAVTVQKSLVGFVELKAPGKGSDPTKASGKGCARYPISFTQTAMDSVSGKMEDSLAQCFIWMATLKPLEPNLLRRPACKPSLKTFCAGNRLRRAARVIWPIPLHAFAGYFAMK